MTKAAAYKRKIQADRQEWAALFDRCMACGKLSEWLPLEVHEIMRKSRLPNAWAHRCNYLCLCFKCHAGPFATAPLAFQLAVKMLADPEFFDLEAWWEIGGSRGLVSQQDVDEYAAILRNKR